MTELDLSLESKDLLRRILITGGSGFVGYHLARVLNQTNAVIFSASSTGAPSSASGINSIQLDICKRDDVASAIREESPDEVFHLAGISSIDASWRDPRLTFEVNVIGTLNVFDAAMSLPSPPRILYVSTSQVYGRSQSPLSESSVLAPDTPYGGTKAMAELLRSQFRRSAKGGIITARPFNHTGPGQSENFVVSSIAKQFVEIKLGLRPPVLTLGNIEVSRDFTDVRDIAQAYKLLMEKGTPGEVYNVCSGRAVGLREVIEGFRDSAGVNVSVKVEASRMRKDDADTIVGDPSKIQKELGWMPLIPFKTTLGDMLVHWEKRLNEH